jgi:hypothetical protein
VYMWTVPPAARRGDLAVIYTKGVVQSYVAVARICCDAREGYDERHWSWLQCQPVAPLPQTAVAAIAGTQRPRTGLNTPAGGRYNEIRELPGRSAFLTRLVEGDPHTAKRLAGWRWGRGSWPRDADCRELHSAEWEPPERRTQEELKLSRRLAETLVDEGLARYLQPEDRLYPRSLEATVTLDDGATRRIDIILISLVHPRPTLLLIETKIKAMPWPGRNPIDQLLSYEPAVRRDCGRRFHVLRWAIAEEFHPLVRQEARALKIPCSQCSADGKSIELLDGHAPIARV